MKTRIVILIAGIAILGFYTVSCTTQNKQKVETKVEVQKTVVKTIKETKLKSSLVCFVNNKFMGIDQIPVEVEGKTYYGCCPDCVGKIKIQRGVRYEKDPFSGNEVDKALAYIVLSPRGNNDVLYFESEQNYVSFIK